MKRRTTIAAVTGLVGLCFLGPPAAEATFAGGNSRIAYGHQTRSGSDIWTIDPKTKDRDRLTFTDKAREMMPDWDSSGERIAYTRCGRDEFDNCEIWTMNADGSEPTRLTYTSRVDPWIPPVQETWPAWSPDGGTIAYVSNANDPFQDIWIMNADGTEQTRLTTTSAFDAWPEFSPDGTKIVFTSNRTAESESDDIWVMDADGTDPVQLTTGKAIDERPDWSPDGAQIVFTRNNKVAVIDADGGNLTKIAIRGAAFSPTFSPNGNSIVFSRLKEDRVGLWRMRADGSRLRRLTSGIYDNAADWQPIKET